MADRLRGARSGISRPRRKTAWTVGPVSGVGGIVQTISASGKAGWVVTAVVASDGITLVRVRGEFMAFLSSTSTALDGFTGAIGICVVSSVAASLGITAIPGPIAQDDWDGWLYHRYLSFKSGDVIDSGVSSEAGQVDSVSAATRFEIDSRAMRKLSIEDTIVGMMEWSEVGTASLRTHINTRLLVKLA